MNKLELMKIANEVRKGAVTAVYNANPDIRVDHCQRQIFTHIYFLRK